MNKKVAIIYLNFNNGGAEAVCAWMMESLKDEYSIDLYTSSKITNKELNTFYGTNLNKDSFKVICPIIKINILNKLKKLITKNYKDYDIIINAKDELDLKEDSIHYIHCYENVLEQPYSNHKFIANSYYTSKRISQKEKDVPVVYPPLKDNFKKIDWGEKEDGFVITGRITPEKDVHKSIQIIEEIRNKGHNINLHIIGTIGSKKYYNFVKKLAKDKKWIQFHQNISNEELRSLLSNNKYGIHCKGNEPFGIAPAEVLYSGGIPFVREKGGQVEVVGTDELIFNNNEEAVEKIISVLKNEEKQKNLLNHLEKQKEILQCHRFKDKFLNEVNKICQKKI